MRIAYFDPFSGASGDMMLGSLIDAGLSLDLLRQELTPLPLDGYQIEASPAGQHGLAGTRVSVLVTGEQPARDWAAIREMIESSHLAPPVKTNALAIFANLAAAEAKVHGTIPAEVHFHEVGGVDAIVDICGAALGLHLLGVERVFSGPPRLGTGFARSQHGLIPVPGPATAELLARAATPTIGAMPAHAAIEAELLTPTGAAILTTLARFSRPDFTPVSVGYGFGVKELPWPNALRLWLGEAIDDQPTATAEWLIETNIDDMNPQAYELLMERLFAAGALDAWLTPIIMKKGRPAVKVSAIGAGQSRAAIERALMVNSTTLGTRASPIERAKAPRRHETVITRFGDVRLKLRGHEGRVISAAPEYDDCARLARDTGAPFQEVWFEAHRLGEVYIGRRIDEAGNLLAGGMR